jgi:hypothetical protein
MTRTAIYRFHELTLEVCEARGVTGVDLAPLLNDMSWVRTDAWARPPALCLAIHPHEKIRPLPLAARQRFVAEGVRGLEHQEEVYLTDGASLVHLQPMRGRGEAWLAPSFMNQPRLLQRHLWAFSLLTLLRPLGLYSLHAAGLVSRSGEGLLLIGRPGSGKSTLTLGLVLQGWGYLSDDAVLLHRRVEGVEALACRQPFYVDTHAAVASTALLLGEMVPDTAGGWKRRVHIREVYPGQSVARCLPRVLLFTSIIPRPDSRIRPVDPHRALRHLLAESGPQLFDRRTMPRHLDVLARLVRQTATYELHAGLNLYHHPARLAELLAETTGEARWHAS